MKTWSYIKQFGFSLVVLAAVTYLSLAPHMPSGLPKIMLFPQQDKVVHGLMYVGLALALTFDYLRVKRTTRVRFTLALLFWGLLFPCLYGGLIEILQGAYFPPRTAEWLDWVADIIGSTIGFFIVVLSWKHLPFVHK